MKHHEPLLLSPIRLDRRVFCSIAIYFGMYPFRNLCLFALTDENQESPGVGESDRLTHCRPRTNRLPQEVDSRPRPRPTHDAKLEELAQRPLKMGDGYDLASTIFSHLSPGEAFGNSQDGLFGKIGLRFWEHVSDVYDWERAICEDPNFRPSIRQLLTGVRLIIGDEFADHIATPHALLMDGKSTKLSQEERSILTRRKYLVMVFHDVVFYGPDDFVILLLQMPNQTVLTFAAHNGNSESKQRLHTRAVTALDKMLRENDLPRVRWYQKDDMGRMMDVTSDSRAWANPYLTLEAFRVFIREVGRQESEYEDWTGSEHYSTVPESECNGDTARDLWCADLRGALGHRALQPLYVAYDQKLEPADQQNEPEGEDMRKKEPSEIESPFWEGADDMEWTDGSLERFDWKDDQSEKTWGDFV